VLAHDEKCERDHGVRMLAHEWCRCTKRALAQAQEEIARLKEREDCHDPLDPCRGCLVCFEGMWNTEVRRREAGDTTIRHLKQERDVLRAQVAAHQTELIDTRETWHAEVIEVAEYWQAQVTRLVETLTNLLHYDMADDLFTASIETWERHLAAEEVAALTLLADIAKEQKG